MDISTGKEQGSPIGLPALSDLPQDARYELVSINLFSDPGGGYVYREGAAPAAAHKALLAAGLIERAGEDEWCRTTFRVTAAGREAVGDGS